MSTHVVCWCNLHSQEELFFVDAAAQSVYLERFLFIFWLISDGGYQNRAWTGLFSNKPKKNLSILQFASLGGFALWRRNADVFPSLYQLLCFAVWSQLVCWTAQRPLLSHIAAQVLVKKIELFCCNGPFIEKSYYGLILWNSYLWSYSFRNFGPPLFSALIQGDNYSVLAQRAAS